MMRPEGLTAETSRCGDPYSLISQRDLKEFQIHLTSHIEYKLFKLPDKADGFQFTGHMLTVPNLNILDEPQHIFVPPWCDTVFKALMHYYYFELVSKELLDTQETQDVSFIELSKWPIQVENRIKQLLDQDLIGLPVVIKTDDEERSIT